MPSPARVIEIEGPIERGVRAAGQENRHCRPRRRRCDGLWDRLPRSRAPVVSAGTYIIGANEATLAGDVGRRVSGERWIHCAWPLPSGQDVDSRGQQTWWSSRVRGSMVICGTAATTRSQLPAGVVAGQVVRARAARTDFVGRHRRGPSAIRSAGARRGSWCWRCSVSCSSPRPADGWSAPRPK